jgi:hypothetical protein
VALGVTGPDTRLLPRPNGLEAPVALGVTGPDPRLPPPRPVGLVAALGASATAPRPPPRPVGLVELAPETLAPTPGPGPGPAPAPAPGPGPTVTVSRGERYSPRPLPTCASRVPPGADPGTRSGAQLGSRGPTLPGGATAATGYACAPGGEPPPGAPPPPGPAPRPPPSPASHSPGRHAPSRSITGPGKANTRLRRWGLTPPAGTTNGAPGPVPTAAPPMEDMGVRGYTYRAARSPPTPPPPPPAAPLPVPLAAPAVGEGAAVGAPERVGAAPLLGVGRGVGPRGVGPRGEGPRGEGMGRYRARASA